MKYFLLIIFVLIDLNSYAQKSDTPEGEAIKKFDGLYLGVNAGIQNVFGGSFVNEMDILAQESKFVSEFALGFRKQFLHNRFLIGLELSGGVLDGSLTHTDADEQLYISYKTSFQHSMGLQAGTVVGKKKNLLLFAYTNETKRTFDVEIQQRQYNFTQTDKQGMLKYGLGVEWQAFTHINIRTSFGALRVDFGELQTNMEVEDKFDASLGIIFQF